MYIIKMNDDKSLMTTRKTHIYRGEKDADTITFLLPQTYAGKDLASCRMFVRFVLPSGTGHSEEIAINSEMYKSYYRYDFNVSSMITYEPGQIEIWLTAIDAENSIILKTGAVNIDVEDHTDIVSSFSEDDSDQLDAIEAELTRLNEEKADNWIYFNDDYELQLLASGHPIGDRLNVREVHEDLPNSIVEFDSDIPSTDANSADNNEP